MTSSARVAVVGYASLDHAMRLAQFRGVDATSLVTDRLSSRWPAAGGIAYLAAAVRTAAPATVTDAVSWVGPDPFAASWLGALAEHGVGTEGVRRSGSRTPSSYLYYLPDGGTICVFDPADCHDAPALDTAQRGVLAAADWVLLTVGPADATRALLDALPDSTRLAWAVKQDRDAFGPDLVDRLLRRADVISHSTGEREFLTDGDGARGPERRCRPGALVLQTRGGDGVTYWRDGVRADTAGRRLDAGDTTGAGDTFIGSLVGLVAAGGVPDDAEALHAAVARAGAAATDFIARRGVTPRDA